MVARTMLKFILLVSFLVAWDASASEPIEDLLAATFRIADRDHSGTCFLVAPKTVDPANPHRVVVATAAHVMEQMAGKECELFLRTESEDHRYSRKAVSITIRNGDQPLWTRHPDVDLASIFVDLPEGVAVKPIPFDQLADEERVIDRTVRVGKETWIPCYPAPIRWRRSR